MLFHGRETLMNESLTSVRATRAFEMKSKIVMKNKPSRRISGLLMSFTTISLQPSGPPNLEPVYCTKVDKQKLAG